MVRSGPSPPRTYQLLHQQQPSGDHASPDAPRIVLPTSCRSRLDDFGTGWGWCRFAGGVGRLDGRPCFREAASPANPRPVTGRVRGCPAGLPVDPRQASSTSASCSTRRITAINAIKESAQCGSTGVCTVDSVGNAVTWNTMIDQRPPAAPRTMGFRSRRRSPASSRPLLGWCAHLQARSAARRCRRSANGQDAVQATATYQYQTFFPLLFGTKINVSVSTEMVIFPPPPPN